MKESDGSRRPSLTRWLTDKVEGLAGGRRAVPPVRRPEEGRSGSGGQGPGGGGPDAAARGRAQPDPAVQKQAAEIARQKQEGERLVKELDDAQVMLIGKEAEFKNDLQEMQERNAELLDKIVKLTQRDRELQAKVLDAKFDGTGARDQVKKLDMDLRDLRRSHQAKEEQIAQLKSQLEALEKEVAGRPDPAQKAAKAEALTRRLQEALVQTKALTRERDELQSRLEAGAGSLASEPDKVRDAVDSPDNVRGHLATGPASDPLKAMAAGKRPAIARQISESRRRRGAAAEKLLESRDRGFATLPEGFVEALLESKHSRHARGEHRAARRGGTNRQRRGRGRSRRSGAGNR